MPELTPPPCPDCGGPMVKRTARTGRRAGKEFWGCAAYPRCRGIVSIEDPIDDANSAQGITRAIVNVRFRPLFVDAHGAPGQCALFQTVALPPGLVRRITATGEVAPDLRSAASWCLDYPLPRTLVSEKQRTIAAIAESILTRGAVTLTAPDFDELVDADAAKPEAARDAVVVSSVAPTCRRALPPHLFDSEEERTLAEALSSTREVVENGWHLVPQVSLASLSKAVDERSEERCDLLLVNAVGGAVVVEVDGRQHRADTDDRRDAALRTAGIQTLRIAAEEIRRNINAAIDRIVLALPSIPVPAVDAGTEKIVRWSRFAHQVAIACVTALKSGWLPFTEEWRVAVSIPPTLQSAEADELARAAVDHARELVHRLMRLYGESGLPSAVVTIGHPADHGVLHIGAAAEVIESSAPAFAITDLAYPHTPRLPITTSASIRPEDPSEEDGRWFLNYLFRKEDFREGQWAAIRRTLIGEDTLVLLPTGGGKSMVFQFPTLLLPGRCLVVEPIISLSEDQCDNLIRNGIDRCVAISSAAGTNEKRVHLQEFEQGQYLFSYVAPQRFQIPEFREALQALTISTPISVIAVDEAHCVSEWGHGFMTAYLNLGRTTREFCSSNGVTPPLVGLTGTASRIVLKDVQRELGIHSFDAIVTPTSFDRPELRFTVIRCRSDEKKTRLRSLLRSLPSEFGVAESAFFSTLGERTHSGIVFCPHANGDYGVSDQARFLSDELRTQVLRYSGKAPRGYQDATWRAEKRRVAQQFKGNDAPLIVATKAFGMGIDKPNIRYTVHLSLPGSIESFYQEAGRAGRDHHPARCSLIVSDDNRTRNQRLLRPDTPLSELRDLVSRRDSDADDINRALWFHANEFKGGDEEVRDVERMLQALEGERETRRRQVSWTPWTRNNQEDGQGRSEKALHRLLLIGYVRDYTVRHAQREYGVELSGATRQEMVDALSSYVAAYQVRLGTTYRTRARELAESVGTDLAFVAALARLLIEFVYDRLELARRRSLLEMYEAATQARDGEALRNRILQYLEATEWDERLDSLRESADGGMTAISTILDDLVSPIHAVALRGATARMLTSYPDVPALLLVRAAAEVMSSDGAESVARDNLEAALRYGIGNFDLEPALMATGVAAVIQHASAKKPADDRLLDAVLSSQFASREFVRALLANLPVRLAATPAWWLRNQLLVRAADLNNMPKSEESDGTSASRAAAPWSGSISAD